MGNDKKTKLALDALKRDEGRQGEEGLASGDGFELEAGPGLTVAKFGALRIAVATGQCCRRLVAPGLQRSSEGESAPGSGAHDTCSSTRRASCLLEATVWWS